MSFDPDEAFLFMHRAYRCGLLDNIVALQGEVMADIMSTMSTLGITQGDVWDLMDEASLEDVMRVDSVLEKFDILSKSPLKYLNNENAMKFLSDLLEVPMIRRKILGSLKQSALK
jgi:hypothetical protein